jgi:xylan 1,4-beta-xylosidase
MKSPRTILAAAVCVAASASAALAADQPKLRDPQIARTPDGTYCLTGTTCTNSLDPRYADFQNNDGVRLWKSKDLKTWEAVGLVWDLSKTGGRDYRKSGWQAHLRSVPGQPDKAWSRGVTAPELHFVKGGWWIVFALNGQDIGLLKSTSGKPEGPYEEVGRLSNRFLGGDGSLFQDSDGKVYLVWGGGYIAPMKEDMSDIAEDPKALQMAIEGYPSEEPSENQMGERGAFVCRDGDVYRYVYAAWTLRDGSGHFETFACEAKSLFGPYSKPKVLIPDGGQATIFRAADGSLKAACVMDGSVRILEL